MFIREAQKKDLSIILEIMNDAILHSTSIYDYEIRSAQFVENWFNKKRLDKLPVLVAEIDGSAVAYGSYGIFRAWDAYKFSVEHSIYVQKNFQGQGIGKQLLIELINPPVAAGKFQNVFILTPCNQCCI